MKKLLITALIAVIFPACSVYQTLTNLSRLQYRLGTVQNVTLAGVSFSGKKSVKDFSLLEITTFTTQLLKGSLPLNLTLNVDALNPNNGTGGYARTDAQLKSFPFRFLVDGKELVTGNISNAVNVPGTGEVVQIPIVLNMDVAQLINNGGYESAINLVLKIAAVGQGGGSSSVELYARPVVSSVLGDISTPGEIRIIEAQFSGN